MNADKIRQYEVDFWERKARESEIVTDVTDKSVTTVTENSAIIEKSRKLVNYCQECGEPFERKRNDARFCGDICRKRFSRKSF